MNMNLVKSDVNLFAVYQTMYSNSDIEMWYDWNRRLEDTKWTDKCYFLVLDGKKIGGAVITDDTIMFPFLVSPFSDRISFWRYLLKLSSRSKINGILDVDNSILPMFNYKAIGTYQVMCRPSDIIETVLPDGFLCRSFDINAEADDIGKVVVEGYSGSYCYEKYGVQTHDEAILETKRVLGVYASKNLSFVIAEKATNQIVGICLAGIGENYTLGYVEIADICVLPQFRGRGLAKYMINNIITQAYDVAPFVKLGVDIGNDAELLYRQLGFISGPRFTNMEQRT